MMEQQGNAREIDQRDLPDPDREHRRHGDCRTQPDRAGRQLKEGTRSAASAAP